jgi:NCS1 family nucleobase:cation symporter-1
MRPASSTPRSFLHFFFPSLTGMVGYWATLSLNIPDFTRYAKSQESQIVGQAFGLPVAMTLYTFIGIAVHVGVDGGLRRADLEPDCAAGRFHQPLIAFLALVSILIATLNVNIGANVVSPVERLFQPCAATDQLSHRRADYGLSGLAMMPWKLMASLWQLHIQVAGGLLGTAGAGGGDHDRGLLFYSRHKAGHGVAVPAGGPYEYIQRGSIRGR